MAVILEMSLKSTLPIVMVCQLFFGINKYLNDIESTGFIYVPISSWFEDSES